MSVVKFMKWTWLKSHSTNFAAVYILLAKEKILLLPCGLVAIIAVGNVFFGRFWNDITVILISDANYITSFILSFSSLFQNICFKYSILNSYAHIMMNFIVILIFKLFRTLVVSINKENISVLSFCLTCSHFLLLLLQILLIFKWSVQTHWFLSFKFFTY